MERDGRHRCVKSRVFVVDFNDNPCTERILEIEACWFRIGV